MFNRQPFNRGRFNIGKKSGGMTGLPIVVSLTAENAEMYSAIHLIGDAEISLECLSAELKSNMLTAEPCNIRLTSEDGFLIKNVKLTAYSSSIYLSTEDGFLQAYNILVGKSKIILTGLADLDFWLSEFINLTNVILAPGKTLVIDTEKMTINIDGTNIMSKLSNDSIFFDLRPGENLITYTGSKPAELRILWKDRYL